MPGTPPPPGTVDVNFAAAVLGFRSSGVDFWGYWPACNQHAGDTSAPWKLLEVGVIFYLFLSSTAPEPSTVLLNT